jgi:hypothetical protein
MMEVPAGGATRTCRSFPLPSPSPRTTSPRLSPRTPSLRTCFSYLTSRPPASAIMNPVPTGVTRPPPPPRRRRRLSRIHLPSHHAREARAGQARTGPRPPFRPARDIDIRASGGRAGAQGRGRGRRGTVADIAEHDAEEEGERDHRKHRWVELLRAAAAAAAARRQSHFLPRPPPPAPQCRPAVHGQPRTRTADARSGGARGAEAW